MKKVIYTCPFIPEEWVRAHGMLPSRVMPRPMAARSGPRSGVCPYAWAFLQTALADESADAVLFTTRCDQMRRLSELAARDADVPTFLLNVPATWRTPFARVLYKAELERLGRFLVRIGGKTPSREELVEAVHRCDAPPEPHRAAPPGAVRLALVGGPLMAQDIALFGLVERAGGTVVLDGTVSGELGRPSPIDPHTLAEDPLEALVESYFEAIADASRRPNDRLYRWLEDRIAERGVQGIIFRHYTWCDTWHAEAGRLKEWAPVPVVVTVAGVEDQLDRHAASRIEAFIEMLR